MANPNGGPGRKSLYKPEYDQQVYKLSLLGHTDEEVAKFFGVTLGGIKNWYKQFPSFYAARAEGKELADLDVVASFRDAALGYEYEEDQVIKVKKGKDQEEVVTVKVKRFKPGEWNAAALWLANRHRHKWKLKGSADDDSGSPATVTINVVGGLPEPGKK